MELSNEALKDLENVLVDQGVLQDFEEIDPKELKEFGLFLLNLTAAAVKLREKMRMIGKELPPSEFENNDHIPIQGKLPGFD